MPLADTHSSLHNACTVSPTLTRIGACASLLDHSRHTQSCLVGRVLPHVRADAQEASGFVLMRALGFPWNQIWFFSPKHSPFTPSQRRKEAIFLRSSRPIAAAYAVVQRRLFARDRAGSHVTGPVCLSGTPGLSGPARIPWTNGLRIASSGALTPQGGRGGERPPAPCPSYGRAAPPAVGT